MARARRTRAATRTEIDNLRHDDKRVNIPTEELREFVDEDEREPKTLLYRRDPSLDPQLVWKGKDEQDQTDLAVQAVPIYIQEKIQPRAIIEDLRRNGGTPQPAQLDLFGDFDAGLEFDELVDFYEHEQNWSNRLILGDSLLVMASLAEKEGLKGQVQMIYLDPPYGIKFGSNWQVSTRKRDVTDGRASDLTRQPEQIKAFRDTWQLGIHSYLTYLRDRLVVARELLTESGSIFVQIGDENVHLVRNLLDEVFGAENFVALITVTKTSGATAELLAGTVDYIIWYAKKRAQIKYRDLFLMKAAEPTGGPYSKIQQRNGTRRAMDSTERKNFRGLPEGSKIYRIDNLTSQRPPGDFPVGFEGRVFRPNRGYWKTGIAGMHRLLMSDRLESTTGGLYYIRFLEDFAALSLTNVWTDTVIAGFASDKQYVVETSSRVIERCLLMTTDPGDLVLDPTCGSGTTAYVAEEWGRRWITIDTSRVALALARTRMMAGRFPYYLLADSTEGRAKEQELTGVVADYGTLPTGDVKKGFVYKRIPHVMLKDIANNEEIDVIHARWQERMEPLRAQLNRLLGTNWEEWEIPRTLDGTQVANAHAADLLAQWWDARRERQREIDASIARRADSETLYDQPYEDNKRVRVTGPFTVESLSPHRVLSTDEERPGSEADGQRDGEANGGFVPMILDHLRKAGVQNTVRNERLKLDRLELYPGEWLQAAGEFSEGEGPVRRVAVSIGPEHGTVGPEWIRNSTREALRGASFDLLIICGFAFDAHASETAKEFSPTPNGRRDGEARFIAEEQRQYGKLPVLLTRMNPDLAMGDELLKNTGAGNLFMVFGEPDLDIQKQADGKLVMSLRGVDVYDPTTGVIRSSSTDDIACWFIDTAYDEESFFVRHAYFTGADEPYDKLKRALRADIDEDAWAALYATTSRPFDRPATGKIAVKVINHYGDEVLKVYAV